MRNLPFKGESRSELVIAQARPRDAARDATGGSAVREQRPMGIRPKLIEVEEEGLAQLEGTMVLCAG